MRMNDAVQAKLKEIVVRYGVSVIDDPLRCQGLLNDLCPSSRREISSLILVLKEGVPTDLMKAGKNTPRQALAARLSRQVADNVGLSEDVARWAVESWARAIESLPPAVQARHQANAAARAKSAPPIKPIKPAKLPKPTPVPVAVTTPARAGTGMKVNLKTLSDAIQHPVVLTSLAVFIVSGLYLLLLSQLYGGLITAVVVVVASGGVAVISSIVIYRRIRIRNAPGAGLSPPQVRAATAAPKGPP
jgi:hypothetical protein